MQKERYDNLVKAMYVQSSSYQVEQMNKFIINELSKIDNVTYYVDDDSIYVTKGEAETYPCQVAHTDTVHKIINNFVIFKHDDKLFSIDGDSMDRVGIGGDDKVGIFVALQMLREVNVMKAAFFRDEEVGCAGSKVADMEFFDDVEFVLQCDRKGYKDFVSEIWGTQMYSTEFSWAIQEILTKFGRKETSGGMTDVYQLAENGLGVCMANMSCGYYDPHSDNEYIVISEVNETLNLCMEIFAGLSGYVWEIKREKKTYNNYFGLGSTYSRNYNGWGRGVVDSIDNDSDWDWNENDVIDKSYDNNKKYYEYKGIKFPEYCYICGGTDLDYCDVDDEMYCWGCDDYVYADRDRAIQHYCKTMNVEIDIDSIDDDVNIEDIAKRYTIDWDDELIEWDEEEEEEEEKSKDVGAKTQIHLHHVQKPKKNKQKK